MARRVLLMVQDTDGGRVKMQPCDAATLAGLKAGTVCVKEAKVHRWWLVECDNAEAARKCIAERPLYGDTGGWPVGVNQHGRILASGGRTK